MKLPKLIIVLAAAAALALAADSPLIGKWKLNPSKSNFAGTTMKYESLPSGEMQLSAEGQSYKFKIDGKEYPAIWGSTASWKQIDPNTFETTIKMSGMNMTETSKLSADGKTMNIVTKGKKPNGENMEESSVWQRVSGGPGLAGNWKSTKVNVSSENWEISPNGDDGLTMKIVDYNAVCTVKFDLKDYPCTGPSIPKDFTMSAKKTGARSVEFTEKVAGKVVYNDTFTVSADGKTLVDEAAPVGSNEKVKAVYDKQ